MSFKGSYAGLDPIDTRTQQHSFQNCLNQHAKEHQRVSQHVRKRMDWFDKSALAAAMNNQQHDFWDPPVD